MEYEGSMHRNRTYIFSAKCYRAENYFANIRRLGIVIKFVSVITIVQTLFVYVINIYFCFQLFIF